MSFPTKPVLDLIGERESIIVGAYCNTPLLVTSFSLHTKCNTLYLSFLFSMIFLYLFFRFLNPILSLYYKEVRHKVCPYKRLKVAKRCLAPFGNFYSKKRQAFYQFPFSPLSFSLLFLFLTRYSILYTRYCIRFDRK